MGTKDIGKSFLSDMNGIESDESEKDDEFNDTSTHAASPKRRRKVDNEGFVRPTTPDIPKTSPYYQYHTINSAYTMSESDESFDQNFTSSFNFDENASSRSDFQVLDSNESYEVPQLSETPKDQSYEVSQTADDQSYAESQFSQSFNDQLNTASQQSQSIDTLSTDTSTTTEDVDTNEDSQSSSQNIYDDMNIADIITDMKEKTAKVYMHWMELFRDGEKFEEEVPSLIDDLLNQAKQMEQHLIEQKESLRQRIYGITRTLRIDNL
ncbi:uncharacterized protein LOC133202361 isoform X2 [Saccostrea echinata]|uniref:uncharacterized protein LOC133202361 isoform X2 n=1 Tax=Saccostrea echinata TaxID=191078 RepID=UPI002A7F4493|nr:uncharacterized protein LOC133202361 isoform X2 [Saccostrea echinata]